MKESKEIKKIFMHQHSREKKNMWTNGSRQEEKKIARGGGGVVIFNPKFYPKLIKLSSTIK